jgi:hypothetical protein
MGRQKWSGYIFLAKHFNPKDRDSTAFETFVYTHHTIRHRNAENHYYY